MFRITTAELFTRVHMHICNTYKMIIYYEIPINIKACNLPEVVPSVLSLNVCHICVSNAKLQFSPHYKRGICPECP